MKPGVYYSGNPNFGLWRLNTYGVWLFCVPVKGATWEYSHSTPAELAHLTRIEELS